jgi:hypothetical protein
MRNTIKRILREFALKEAEETPHSKCRYINRVIGKEYTTTNVKDKIGEDGIKKINFIIELVKKIDFPERVGLAINLALAPSIDVKNPKSFENAKGFYFNDPKDNCTEKKNIEDTWGHYLWLIIRGNSMTTIMIDKDKPKSLREVNIDRLLSNLNNYFGLNIKEKELSSVENLKQIDLTNERLFFKMISKPEKNSEEPPLKKEEMFLIKQKKYVIDKIKKTIHPKNKPKEIQKIEEFVELILNSELIAPEDEKAIEYLISLI